jgi:dTDP-4-amino-4,6-dideoxygalactose transaminase
VTRDVLALRVKKGDDVAELESTVRALVDANHAVAVPQARIGIFLAVSALVNEKKKKVILSPYTICDVINMVICAGAEPVFADIERGTCNISADNIEQLIDGETAAVLVTHLHGLACDIQRISALCKQRGLALIEDCAQALGARVGGKMVGSFGDVGIYSFGRSKNINALFGGMLVTRHRDLADTARRRLSEWPYFPAARLVKQAILCLTTNVLFSPPWFPVVISRLLRYSNMTALDPFNKIVRGEHSPTRRPALPPELLLRLTPMQARLVRQQLPEVDRLSAIRTEYARVYHEGLADIPEITLPPWRADGSHVYLTFAIQVQEREDLLAFLLSRGRDVIRQYLNNIADAECFAEFHRSCPCAREAATSTLLLPTYPGYGMKEVKRNLAAVREYYLSKRGRRSSVAASTSSPEVEAEVESKVKSAIAMEGTVLLHYVLGHKPDPKMVELYVYAIQMTVSSPVPLRLPRVAKRFPRLLRLFEPVMLRRSGKTAHPFRGRLAEASRIADIGFAPLFYDYQGTGFLRSVVGVAAVGLLEATILPIRLVFGRLWWG